MKYLLATTGTIESGVGFKQFDPCHVLWLLGGAAFVTGMGMLYRRLKGTGRVRMRHAMAAAVVADELFKLAVLLIGGNFAPKYLPLHLCSINVFLIAYHAWKPNRVLDNFLYTVCIPGALAALFFPNWTKLPPSSLMHIHSFTFHILLVCYPAMQLAGRDIRPEARCIPKCLLLLAILACIVAIANRVFDTNFMFLSYASKGNPLYWFEKNWGCHLAGYAMFLPAVLLTMYAPQLVRALRRRRIVP